MMYFRAGVRPAVVHAYARHLLSIELALRDYKQSVPASLLASVLLLAACWQTSLSCACEHVRGTPSRETVRKALFACLPPRPCDLLERIVQLLRRSLPEHLRDRFLAFVLDIHRRPYYGKSTRGSSKGQEKKSTKKAFAYATLAVLSDEGRFTVGLMQVRQYMHLTTILARLLQQAAAAELRISYLLLDKEFYAAEVIDWLKRHAVAFLMPALCKQGKNGAGNAHLFDPATAVGWYEYSWTARLRRWDFKSHKRMRKSDKLTVTVKMCVAREPKKNKRLVYASWGLGKWSPAEVVKQYRRRFGIEVKYRQMGQGMAVTTSRDERVRLLLVGVALLLCNVWAYLHSEVYSLGALGERRLRLSLCRLRVLCRDLADSIATSLGGKVDDWPSQHPLPDRFAPFAHAG
jgi:putative transposase